MDLTLTFQFLLIVIFAINYCNTTNITTNEDGFFMTFMRRTFTGGVQKFQVMNKLNYKHMQDKYPKSLPFFCNTNQSSIKRSPIRPNSINRLRPGDIDVIAAMGDSLTGGNGILGATLIELLFENRGVSFSIGGDGTWRDITTLPNILKEFNPNIYGYSSGTSITFHRASKFNVAEAAAASKDMLFQAKVLKLRFERDSTVNMTHDWKMVTMFFGGIDLCHVLCDPFDANKFLTDYENNLVKVLRYFRDNIPRIMVNIVSAPDLALITKLKKPLFCDITISIGCECFTIFKTKEEKDRNEDVIQKWYKIDDDVTNRDEFHTETFTAHVQPFSRNITFPHLKNGEIDLTYFSADCFHLSQRSHAKSSISLWNNLLEPYGQKSDNSDFSREMKFKCPTAERPFLATKLNSLKTRIEI